jgi:hypothetical protein
LGESAMYAVCTEAEVAARNLLDLGDKSAAKEAFTLCYCLGGRPPISNSRLVNALRGLVPAWHLFQLHQYWRKRLA